MMVKKSSAFFLPTLEHLEKRLCTVRLFRFGHVMTLAVGDTLEEVYDGPVATQGRPI